MKEHPLPDLDMLDQYSNMVTILLLCSLKKKKATGKAFMYRKQKSGNIWQRALSESLRPKLNNQYYCMELFITENVV